MHTAEAAAAPAAAPTAAPAAPGTFWQFFQNVQTHLAQTHLAFSDQSSNFKFEQRQHRPWYCAEVLI